MRTMATTLLTLCLFAGPALAEETNCMTTVAGAFEAALVAGDLDGIMGLYLDSEEIQAVESSGKLRRGRTGIRTMYQEAFAEATWTAANFELIRTDLGDSEGFCYFRFVAKGAMKGNTDTFELNAQGTWIVRNTKAGWKIIHEHMSPLDSLPRLHVIKTEPPPAPEATPEATPEPEPAPPQD